MMKKLLLLFIAFYALESFGQDPELFGTWFLHSLNVEDTEYIPDNLMMNLDCNFRNGEIFENEFHFPNSSTLETFQLTIDENTSQFVLGQSVGLTLGICNNNQECYNFFAIYGPFYFNYVNTQMEYDVSTNSNGSRSLVVTNVDGDFATYNSEPLLASNDFFIKSFKIYPNPVSEKLLILSEKSLPETLIVYSMTGQKMMEISAEKVIDVSSLSKGMYFLEIISKEGKSIKKFIKI